MRICIDVFLYICVYVYMCVCVYVYMYQCIYVYMHSCLHVLFVKVLFSLVFGSGEHFAVFCFVGETHPCWIGVQLISTYFPYTRVCFGILWRQNAAKSWSRPRHSAKCMNISISIIAIWRRFRQNMSPNYVFWDVIWPFPISHGQSTGGPIPWRDATWFVWCLGFFDSDLLGGNVLIAPSKVFDSVSRSAILGLLTSSNTFVKI